MTELEKIAYAKAYVDKLANGINPLTDEAVPSYELINDVHISRCLFFVSDILRQVVVIGGISKGKKESAKTDFQLDYEARKAFQYSEPPISISEITRRINALIDMEKMKKLNYKHISDWLTECGFLRSVTGENGKMSRMPSESGLQLGISTEQRQGQRGPYTAVLYSKAAQQFILDNLDAVIERSRK